MNLDMSFIPDGTSGKYSISTYKIGIKEVAEQTLSMLKTGRFVPQGVYKKLMFENIMVMSNTPDEINDFYPYLSHQKGDILINGLGLGCTVKFLLMQDSVSKITVIEKSKDVIDLVAPYFEDSRLEIINDDAFTYQPKQHYNYVWHDIWNFICEDNLEEIKELKSKYKKKCNNQNAWLEKELKKQRRIELNSKIRIFG